MSIELWLAFVAASAVMLIIPGPTILTVISYSMAHGRRANIPLVAAVALGDSTALAVSLLGLGALLATSAFWFTLVKGAGGLYLLYLGIKLLRAGISPAEIAAPAAPGSRWRLFANTYLVTALNPQGHCVLRRLPAAVHPSRRGRDATALGAGRHLRRHGRPECHAVCRVRRFGTPAVGLAARAAALQHRGRLPVVRRGRLGADGPPPSLNRPDERVAASSPCLQPGGAPREQALDSRT
jgi:hypothetical protein